LYSTNKYHIYTILIRKIHFSSIFCIRIFSIFTWCILF